MEQNKKTSDILKLITIEKSSRQPKYRQIVDAIVYQISIGNLIAEQKIPSINVFSEELYLSRDTVEKAYSILKERKIIKSINRIGYFINNIKLTYKVNVLFLINKLSPYKMIIYNAFIENIGLNVHTKLEIYHCEESLFINSLEKNKSTFDYFVIIPHFKNSENKHVSYTNNTIKTLNQIPRERLILLDNAEPKIEEPFGEIYQNFENDIYKALKVGLYKISSYRRIILVYPEKTIYPYPRSILNGYRKFCIEHEFDYEIIDTVFDNIILKKGDLFIVLEEEDLVSLINQINNDEYTLGNDIGLISYNDTPLKELLGITVMSADFKIMGKTVANIILNKKTASFKVPFRFVERKSI